MDSLYVKKIREDDKCSRKFGAERVQIKGGILIMLFCFVFLIQYNNICGNHEKRLAEALLMSTSCHKIYFIEK